MKRITLYKICNDKTILMRFLLDYGLCTQIICPLCNSTIFLNINSLQFWCRTRRNYIQCNFKKKYFSNEHLFGHRIIKLDICIYLLYEFVMDTSIKNASHEYEVSEGTVSRVFKVLRHKTNELYFANEPQIIGGPGIIIEWDESLLVKCKNHTGRIPQGQRWLFGGVVRGDSTKCFVEHVERRNTATLVDVVRR